MSNFSWSIEDIEIEGEDLDLEALGGKGSGNFGHSGRPGEKGGSGEGSSGDAPKVRNERSMRALKAFIPIHAEAQRHAEKNELSVRRMIGGTRTDDNLPVDVVTTIDGKVKGVEVKTMINNTNDKITMRKAAVEKKNAWAKQNHATVHTVVIDDRGKLGNKGYSGHRIYYRKGPGSFRLESMVKVQSPGHLKALLAGRTLKGLGGQGSGNFGHEGRPGEVGGSGEGGGGGEGKMSEGVSASSIVVTGKQKHTKDQIATAWDMKQKGSTSGQIQKATGLHPSTQYHHFKKMVASAQVLKQEIQKPSSKPPAHHYWKKNPETGKYEKTLTSTGKAALVAKSSDKLESEVFADKLQKEQSSSGDVNAKDAHNALHATTSKEETLAGNAEKYGYAWKEKTTGPSAGKYAWFKGNVQVSAPHDKSDAEKAAASMHYGTGPKSAPVFEPSAPTPEGWPISNEVDRQMGSNYPKEMDKVGTKWSSTLTFDERVSVKGYTGHTYHEVNNALRSNPNSMSKTAKEIQSAIDKAPSPPPPELVWRGISGGGSHVLGGLTAGDTIQLNGFQSTSINPSFAKSWGGGKFVLEIKPSKGAYLQSISSHKHEREYLLPHGSSYKVHGMTSIKVNGTPVNVIQLEQLHHG